MAEVRGHRPTPMLHGTDDRYMLDLGEHVDRIKDYHLRQLGLDLNGCWTELAGRLGISNSEVRAIEDRSNRVSTFVAGYEALASWRQRPNSTIRVLREVLVDMRRDDAVMKLDNYRLNKVRVTVVVHRNGRVYCELSGSCPARKPLVDHVRPQLYRQRSMDDHMQRGVVVQMSVGQAVDGAAAQSPRLSWTSPAENFESQQVNTEMFDLLPPTPQRPHSTNSRRVSVDSTRLGNGRRVISWIQDDSNLVFSVADETVETVPIQETLGPDCSCRSLSEARGPISRTSDSDLSSGSVNDSVCDEQFENRLPDDEVFETESIELREARSVPGFHFIDPTLPGGHQPQITAILRSYMTENGRYIIRNTSRYKDIKLAISVTYNGGMLNYYVYSQQSPSSPTRVAYTLSADEGYRWSSLCALIEYYRTHPLQMPPESPSQRPSANPSLSSVPYFVEPILTHGAV